MPKYSFKCDECNTEKELHMPIPEFLKKKDNIICCDKKMEQVLYPVASKVEKDKFAIVQEIEEDARKIVEKVKSGDEATIRDVYGERLNPLKFNNKPVEQPKFNKKGFTRVKTNE